jgi:hypothetical protein
MYIYDVKYSCMCIPFINNANFFAYYIYINLNFIYFYFSQYLIYKNVYVPNLFYRYSLNLPPK